jgi:hypothetical protein
MIPLTMKIRRGVLERIEPRGVTPRRLAAANRVLARERERLALFASQVLAEQETADNRIRRIDADNLRHGLAFRDLAAKHWREGRRMLKSLPPDLQAQLLEAWNQSSIPPHAAYFVDFVRTQLRRRGILGSQHGTGGHP